MEARITCLPQFYSAPCKSSSSSQHSDQLEPWSSCWGSPVEALLLYSNTQSHWLSGSTFCFPPMGASIRVSDMHLHSWNWDSPVSDVSLQRNISSTLNRFSRFLPTMASTSILIKVHAQFQRLTVSAIMLPPLVSLPFLLHPSHP